MKLDEFLLNSSTLIYHMFFKRHLILLIGVCISIILIVLLLFLKSRDYLFLDLDVKWLFAAGVPILLALFLGEYIKTFKGLGFELEANLKDTSLKGLISKFNFTPQIGFDKDSIQVLQGLSQEEKLKYGIIRFIISSRNYDSNAINTYLRELRNLKFLEIMSRNGDFLYLIPISAFKDGGDMRYFKIDSLIRSIRINNIESSFPMAIKNFVYSDENLIEVYKKILDTDNYENDEILPVLNRSNKLIGIVSKYELESKIARQVVETLG